MATRSTWSLTVALMAAAAGVAAFNFYRSSHRRSGEQVVLAVRARLDADRQTAEERLATAERERAQLQAELATRAKQNARPPERSPGMPAPTPPGAAQLARQAKQAQARLTLKYAPFYRASGIDAATAAKFEQLLREHEAQERDVWEISRGLPAADRTEGVVLPGSTEDVRLDPAIAAMLRRLAVQLEAEQIELLGAERHRRLQEYQRDEGKRRVVEQLVGDLTLTETPLTPAQTGQLVSILAQVDLAGKRAPDEKHWPKILARAGSVLSAPQLAVLKKQADQAERAAASAAVSKLLREQAK